MINDRLENECIQLSLPVNAAYVSAARLTASSIANRMSFDIDEIEDIKAAVSEACTFIIKKLSMEKGEELSTEFKIKFMLSEGVLEISIDCGTKIVIDPDEEEISLIMIKALMDKFEFSSVTRDSVTLLMTKTHKELTQL